MLHYTNKKGYKVISSQKNWLFKAAKPKAYWQPEGAYFTDYLPHEPNLCKKLFIPKVKTEYIFVFRGNSGLKRIPGGRGRLRRVFYSSTDYMVKISRQLYKGKNGVK